eukprot:Skav225012  [mRNA]  locus=scaffold957:290044:290661:- [translate_table: standard]
MRQEFEALEKQLDFDHQGLWEEEELDLWPSTEAQSAAKLVENVELETRVSAEKPLVVDEPCASSMEQGRQGRGPCGTAASDGRAAHLAKLRAEVEALRMKEASRWRNGKTKGEINERSVRSAMFGPGLLVYF